MTNSYTSSSDCFSEIVEGGYSSSDYPQMATMVTAASRLIDAEFGRWPGFFYPSTSDETRYYDGSGYETQDIDEFVSVTTVSVSEQGETSSTGYTDWATTDYLVWPYNHSANGKPIKRLIIDSNGTKAAFYEYRKAVKVVGVPGYSATPPDIVAQVCKIQAIRWFMRAKQGYQDIGGRGELGGIKLSQMADLEADILALLRPLRLELS